jgi:hypothetical protein
VNKESLRRSFPDHRHGEARGGPAVEDVANLVGTAGASMAAVFIIESFPVFA